jgi:hypothetical protein
MSIKHGVFIKYGVTEFELSAAELQLIADALEVVNPDTDKMKRKAQQLSASFLALSEYAASVKSAKDSRKALRGHR